TQQIGLLEGHGDQGRACSPHAVEGNDQAENDLSGLDGVALLGGDRDVVGGSGEQVLQVHAGWLRLAGDPPETVMLEARPVPGASPVLAGVRSVRGEALQDRVVRARLSRRGEDEPGPFDHGPGFAVRGLLGWWGRLLAEPFEPGAGAHRLEVGAHRVGEDALPEPVERRPVEEALDDGPLTGPAACRVGPARAAGAGPRPVV